MVSELFWIMYLFYFFLKPNGYDQGNLLRGIDNCFSAAWSMAKGSKKEFGVTLCLLTSDFDRFLGFQKIIV